MKKLKIVIFGTGAYYNNRKEANVLKDSQVVAFLDNDPKKQGVLFEGATIIPPQAVKKIEFDYIVLMSIFADEMRIQLQEEGIAKEKILTFLQYEILNENLTRKKIVIFGTGKYYDNRKDSVCFQRYDIVAFLDNDQDKQGSMLEGIPILKPDIVSKLEVDYIVLMSIYEGAMKKQLLDLNISESKIITYGELVEIYRKEYHNSGIIPEEILIETENWQPLVSIIVPNYNHEKYLRERLESIYQQTYSKFEVILLDDCSTDKSRNILEEFARKYPKRTRTVFNNKNSGHVFLQWNKGLKLAKGNLIWIAESDDYCDTNFLEVMVDKFRQESVMLAFAKSEFVSEGKVIWTLEEYLHDLPNYDWNTPFVATANEIVANAFSLKNIVPNASSAVFRNIGKISDSVVELWEKLKLCGDWIFYLSLIRGGCISYTPETTNYYRVHVKSTSKIVQKNFDYYREQEEVSKFICRNYKVDLKIFEKEREILKQHYRDNNGFDVEMVDSYYRLDEIKNELSKRKPNILMCEFSFGLGGGETYPLYLANELKNQGWTVTIFDFNMEGFDEQIRKMLDIGVPLVRIKHMEQLADLIKIYGGEIIHSHHASVDCTVSDCLYYNPKIDCKQVITLHGMYEAISKENCRKSIEKIKRTCKKYIYIADKNLIPFEQAGILAACKDYFIKLPNGLPRTSLSKMDREDFGIESEAFVLCLVSRALPEKGWKEAVEAVEYAQLFTSRPIHLILLGAGEMYEKLKERGNPKIHVLGRVNNTRDYFCMSDMGVLPTYFKGESYPLVIIDSLMCGKPVIATNIAEIKNQLTDERGNLAGELIELVDGYVDYKKIAEIILKVAEDEDYYKILCERTSSAAKKFDISVITREYGEIYGKLIE
ncbi:hypothetical protein C0033_08590 [Clostridium sp. chh4-2]|uniref:glycosyltransferase n=1 Tax=Clostridium sp. chh4-2 TaxID=2067550 RepID=UPI000CCEBD03|nr:glycosyltransferase [Clostridium sp. chh4-2]PNV62605.1 hypothetical protein C0033_08590 [Clostridium sp. chh4-2]